MAESGQVAVAEAVETERSLETNHRAKPDVRTQRQPRYRVVLWDDDDHSYPYVIRMMRDLFGHTIERGYAIAKEVDTQGKAIVLTTTREHAELKRDQIRAFGADVAIASSAGSMRASIEPEPA
jgi:ATP-dependent Clp protease adaptor protein ClpS